MRKPIVLISGVLDGSGKFALNGAYSEMVWQSGAIPVLATFQNAQSVTDYLSFANGILLSGGGDVHPKRYGEEIEYPSEIALEEARDAFEFALFEKAFAKKMPILGVCRGIQLMAVAKGGSLHQKIKGHSGGVTHNVRWQKKTANAPSFVNSYHSQSIKTLPRGAEVLAISEDGNIEGIRFLSHPFAVGVQWHPERQKSEWDQSLFCDFIAAVRRYREAQDAVHGAEY